MSMRCLRMFDVFDSTFSYTMALIMRYIDSMQRYMDSNGGKCLYIIIITIIVLVLVLHLLFLLLLVVQKSII